jgi:hypothetical protein
MTIRSEIESRLYAYAQAQTPKIPVSYENVSFVKPNTGHYLEVYLLDTVAQSRGVSAKGVRETGMFQINCYTSVGAGMASVEALAAAVKALYPVIPKTGTVSIEAPLSASSAVVIDGFVCIPVTGRYRVET